MPAIDFPNSPTLNQTFTVGQVSYKWNGTAWVANNISTIDWTNVANKPTTFTPSAHAASHAAGGSDAITVTTGQVTGLSTFVKTIASDINTKTANYTLVAGDANSLIQADGTFTITVPASTVPAGTRVDIVNTGTGVITIAGSGLTLQSKDSKVTVAAQYAGATLFFTSTTTALLIGDLT